jgi:PD-(D/E)XK nuclease superfamily
MVASSRYLQSAFASSICRGVLLDSNVGDVPDLLSRPKKDDIDKMHAYRDAIRDRSSNRVVAFASILYPGPTVNYGNGIAALKALPGEDNHLGSSIGEIISTALVGAVR